MTVKKMVSDESSEPPPSAPAVDVGHDPEIAVVAASLAPAVPIDDPAAAAQKKTVTTTTTTFYPAPMSSAHASDDQAPSFRASNGCVVHKHNADGGKSYQGGRRPESTARDCACVIGGSIAVTVVVCCCLFFLLPLIIGFSVAFKLRNDSGY